MKVLLVEDIKNMGKRGEVKEVAGGFARNFLFPQNMAVPATPQSEAEWKIKLEKRQKEAEFDLKKTQETASRLDGYELEIGAKAGEDGRLYGGIGAQKISELLKKRGLEVNKRQIIIAEPIKTLGEHRIVVRFEHGLEAEARVIVAPAA